MALTSIVEPYVSVTENIRDFPVQLDIDGTANIGGVIIAPTGPRLAYVSGPSDFLSKYTVDGQVPRNADITFLNAYYLSFSAGLVIARSMNTTAVGGMYFSAKKIVSQILLLSADSDSFWGFMASGYFFYTAPTESSSDFITQLESQISELDETDDAERIEDLNSKLATLKKLDEGKWVYCTDYDDLANQIEAKIKVSSTYSNLIGGIVYEPTESVGGFTVSCQVGISTDTQEDEERYALVGTKVNFKDGVPLTETDELTVDTSNFSGNWAFTYGSMAYYHGAINKSKYSDYSLVKVDSIDDIATSISGIKGMTANYEDGSNKIVIEYSKGNKLDIGNLFDGNFVTSPDALTFVSSKYTEYEKKLFSIYPNIPSSEDNYSIKVQEDEGDLFLLTLSNGTTSNTYTVSLISDAEDQDGNNAFIENLNATQSEFIIETNSNYKFDALAEGEESIREVTPKSTQIFKFGNSGLDLSQCSKQNCKINAWYELEDQELYDIEYIAPMGETDMQVIRTYMLVGKNNDWFAPVDIPYSRTNSNSIKSFFINLDDTSNSEGMGPFDNNVGLTGWQFKLACSSLYYQRVMTNRAANSEFAPVFDQTNGILNFTNPVYTLGKEERTKLLNFRSPVNFVIYNQRKSIYYLNDNRTLQPKNNIVSEEQNRRMVNKIKKDFKKLLQTFKGRLNTVSTRADVESMGTAYFEQNLMNQNYKPVEYQIICDESNNTTDIINANKMGVTVRVRLSPSTKYIDVLVDVFPLGVDFES